MLFDNVQIGKDCKLEDVIIDKRVVIPDKTVIEKGKLKLTKAAEKRYGTAEEYFKPFITESGRVVITGHHDYRDLIQEDQWR